MPIINIRDSFDLKYYADYTCTAVQLVDIM